MKLLDAATVNPQDENAARWLNGYKGTTRACSVHMEIQQPCPADPEDFDADVVNVIGTVDSRPSQYDVLAFPVRSYLRSSTLCQRDDDAAWFAEAIKTKLDYLASRALVLETVGGSDTWIGAAGVQSVALAGSPTPTVANWRSSIAAARKLWMKTVVSRSPNPIMHVPYSLHAEIASTGLIQITGPGEASTATGDKVVIADGYDEAATPRVFFSGEIVVRLGDGDGLPGYGQVQYDHRLNDWKLENVEWISVDVAPCSIVRVGA